MFAIRPPNSFVPAIKTLASGFTQATMNFGRCDLPLAVAKQSPR
jgi:hypothetical protein